MTLALVTALALSANPTVVDLFIDKGDHFIKAGKKQGLAIGVDVAVLGDRIGDTAEYRTAGSATVMEVWDNVSRVALDAEAKKHPEAKHVRLAASGSGKGSAKEAKSDKGEKAEKAEKTEEAAGLKGSAKIIGFGPARQITVNNNGTTNWSNCELRLPTNKRFKVAALKAGDHESVVLPKFEQDGVEHDKPLDVLMVKCDQGSGSFPM
jgi:hypothetical protein